ADHEPVYGHAPAVEKVERLLHADRTDVARVTRGNPGSSRRISRVPTYEYRCRECDTVFELERPMRESSAAATCPDGHRDAVRVLSLFAAVTSTPGPAAPAAAAAPCSASCACHPS